MEKFLYARIGSIVKRNVERNAIKTTMITKPNGIPKNELIGIEIKLSNPNLSKIREFNNP